jgi:hypothetical protein
MAPEGECVSLKVRVLRPQAMPRITVRLRTPRTGDMRVIFASFRSGLRRRSPAYIRRWVRKLHGLTCQRCPGDGTGLDDQRHVRGWICEQPMSSSGSPSSTITSARAPAARASSWPSARSGSAATHVAARSSASMPRCSRHGHAQALVPAQAGRLLRPQPGPRRARAGRALPCSRVMSAWRGG